MASSSPVLDSGVGLARWDFDTAQPMRLGVGASANPHKRRHRTPADNEDEDMSDDTALLRRRREVLGPHAPLFYDKPLHLVRGEGVWVYDADGRRYLDVYNNVPHIGHCHPRVVEALCRQAGLLNLNTRYLHETVVAYAERLTATFDDPLSVALFTCTGTEANELALRIARNATGGTGVIVSDFSYHGNSHALSQLTTGLPLSRPVAAHVRAVPIPDLVHAGQGADPDVVGRAFADKVAEAIESMRRQGVKLAAALFDTIFSTEGLPRIPPNYLRDAIDHVRAAGGLFIADEVQPGFGRMGDHMWGYQAAGLTPDLVTLGKPMGNGHPLAGVITRPDLLESFSSQAFYFNTFAGNPVSAAVGLAVLDVLEDEALMANARSVGTYIQSHLDALANHHPMIESVRGRGLFFGLELVDPVSRLPATAPTGAIVNALREQGVLVSRIGPHANVLKMRPPMPFSRNNADQLAEALDHVFTILESR